MRSEQVFARARKGAWRAGEAHPSRFAKPAIAMESGYIDKVILPRSTWRRQSAAFLTLRDTESA